MTYAEYQTRTAELCGDRTACRAPNSYFHNARPWDYERVFEAADFLPTHRVLEVGALHSYFAIAASQLVRHYTATDSFYWATRDYASAGYQTPAEWCRYVEDKGCGGVTAEWADAQDLKYPDEGFDRVVAISTIEHVHDDRRALAELLRVLVPGGRLLLTTEYNPTWSKPYSESDGSFYRVYDDAGIGKLTNGIRTTCRRTHVPNPVPGTFTTLFLAVEK